MHNLHFNRVEADSSIEACHKVYNHYNKSISLDFKKLDVNEDDFKELEDVQPYDHVEYDSFHEYLEEVIDIYDIGSVEDLMDELLTSGRKESYNKLYKFLKDAGFDTDLDDNSFHVSVKGAVGVNDAWDYEKEVSDFDFTIDKIKRIVAEDDEQADFEAEGFLDEVTITDWEEGVEENEKIYYVVLDVRG